MKAVLVGRAGCPGLDAARGVLRRALARVGLPPEFEEVDGDDERACAALGRWGSPTILIDGADVSGEVASAAGPSCRLYAGAGGARRRAPSTDLVAQVILRRIS